MLLRPIWIGMHLFCPALMCTSRRIIYYKQLYDGRKPLARDLNWDYALLRRVD